MPEIRDRECTIRVDKYVVTGLHVTADVERTTKHEPNKCALSIYNLAQSTREALNALSLKPKKSGTQNGRIQVEIEAGYRTLGSSLVFRGDCRTCVSTKSGADWITKIEGEDGGRGVLLGQVSESLPPGTPYRAAALACLSAMGVGAGNLDEVPELYTRTFRDGAVVHGKAADELRQLIRSIGYSYSVQNNLLQVSKAGVAVATTAIALRPGTGLIGSPELDANGTVRIRCQIIPGIAPGARVLVDSSTTKGIYTIVRDKVAMSTFGGDWHHDLEVKA